MRQSGTWMTIWDDRILEVIREKGPTPVGDLVDEDSIRISQSSVSRRCQKLADNVLLQPIGNGVYDITGQGEAYLEGTYDAENNVFLEENNVSAPSVGERSEGSIEE